MFSKSKLVNYGHSFVKLIVKYSSNIGTPFDLGTQMKHLNDKKQFKNALELFEKYKCTSTTKISTFVSVQALKACASMLDLKRGLDIYTDIPSFSKNNSFVIASSIHLFMQCGDVERAQTLFNTSSNKSVHIYGAMMKGYIKNNIPRAAIELFDEIREPDEVIFIIFFNACAQLGSSKILNLIEIVSCRIPKEFYSNHRLTNSLLDALMKCKGITNAELLFNSFLNKTSEMYGIMMKGYIQNNMANKAIQLFNDIRDRNEMILTIFFNACSKLANRETLDLMKSVLSEIPEALYSNQRLVTSLLDGLIKCGDIVHAQSIFDKLKINTPATYSVMMKGYTNNNAAKKAIDIFFQVKNPNDVVTIILFNACAKMGTDEALRIVKKVLLAMPKSFYSNPRVFSSILDSLMKCGDIAHAEQLFQKSTNRTIEAFGAMMKGYIKNNMPTKAIELLKDVKQPNEIIFTLFFNACAKLATDKTLHLLEKVSNSMPQHFYSDEIVSNALLDAFIKCGDCSTAEIHFSKTKRTQENYASLMAGFIKESKPEKTLDLFDQMKKQNMELTIIIYLLIIKALSKIRDSSASKTIVELIPKTILNDPQIQTALIDMWGKSGAIHEAQNVYQLTEQKSHITYSAMINSFGLNGMGIQAVELFRQLPSEFIDNITHICILNACSHSGLVDEARSIFKTIKNKTDKIYTTMIDCLCRAWFFEEAQVLIDEFERHHQPVLNMYMAMLSGARNEKNVYLSEQVFNRIKQLFPGSSGELTSAIILLSNTLASSGEIEKASNIRANSVDSGLKRKVGVSSTIVNGQYFQFRAHDQSHPRSSEIYTEINKISLELVEHGHQYDSSWITRPLADNETISSALCGHSERLAIAWNFVANPDARRIQITKNLRVCGDCHRATKLIALIRKCEIIVSDANRIHHFYPNGNCSCNDYF